MNYKNIFKGVLVFLLLFFSFSQVFSSGNLFTDDGELPYCDNNECSYSSGVKLVKTLVDNNETSKTLSEYIQSVIIYLLTFLSIIAVIYIIYAGFKIMIGGGSEDALKKSRTTILHVIIGIVIIWLAYSIVIFIIDILNSASVEPITLRYNGNINSNI
ncbi:MAG: hypothetical protein WC850_04830 [Candidatus Gracilibacteria bacterium]